MQWAEKIPDLLEILPPIDVKKAANLVFEVAIGAQRARFC